MATWGLRWQVPFKTKDDITMCVNIYDKGYTGTSSYLTAAPEPFTTQEYDGNDIFTPIRSQTGYIRIVDDSVNGDMLEQMMPTNNLQRMVKVYDGTWSNGVFVSSGNVIWQGYMAAQAYTQNWEKDYDVIEFPVNSMLESLNYVQVPVGVTSPVYPLARILVDAFGSEYGLDADIENFRMISPFGIFLGWYTARIDINTFYHSIEIHNQGQSYDITEGDTMYSVLSEVLRLFGMTAREKGNDIWFCQYDQAANLRLVTFNWIMMLQLASGGTSTGFVDSLATTALMTQLSSAGFRGKSNKVSFIPGYNRAQVEFSFNTEGLKYIRLPQTTEDESAVSEYVFYGVGAGTLYVQHHEPRVNSVETFAYNVIRISAGIEDDPETGITTEYVIPYGFYATSNYNNFKSAFPQPLSYGQDEYDDNYITIGAEPCRWFFKERGSGELVSLKNGMLIQFSLIYEPTYVPQKSDFSTDYSVYKIQSASSVSVQANGYICISSVFGQGANFMLLLELQIGSYFWNGTSWTTTRSQFLVSYDGNGKIVGTKPDDVDGGDGLYIPTNRQMTGTVTLTIHRDTDGLLWGIMEELSVSFVYKRSAVESERTSNCYVKNILQMGFSEDISTSLVIGTHNNNIPSISFLRNANNAYIETMTYRKGSSSTVTERPELNLLDRMVKYYSKIRRTYEAVVRDRVSDIFNCVYTDQGRAFMAVDADHNWRDGKQRLKFIEVTADNE